MEALVHWEFLRNVQKFNYNGKLEWPIRIFSLLDVLKIPHETKYSNTEIIRGYYDSWR
jgi:hypothetical protein